MSMVWILVQIYTLHLLFFYYRSIILAYIYTRDILIMLVLCMISMNMVWIVAWYNEWNVVWWLSRFRIEWFASCTCHSSTIGLSYLYIHNILISCIISMNIDTNVVWWLINQSRIEWFIPYICYSFIIDLSYLHMHTCNILVLYNILLLAYNIYAHSI